MSDVARGLFDLDGTLTDSRARHPALDALRARAADASGGADFPIPADDGAELDRRPAAARTASPSSSAPTAPSCCSAFFASVISTIGLFENAVYDGVVEALERLTALDYRLFVATSKVEPYARRILDHFGPDPVFRRRSTAREMDGRRSAKSELLAYLLGRERIGATRRAVMIGDRRYDALGARAVGMRSDRRAWGYGDAEELAAAGADPLIETPRQIPAAVGLGLRASRLARPRQVCPTTALGWYGSSRRAIVLASSFSDSAAIASSR